MTGIPLIVFQGPLGIVEAVLLLLALLLVLAGVAAGTTALVRRGRGKGAARSEDQPPWR